jgi:hypothetical protein
VPNDDDDNDDYIISSNRNNVLQQWCTFIYNCSYLHQAGSQTHEHSGAAAYSNVAYTYIR